MKSCTKCGEEKPLTGFYLNRCMPDGRQYSCKECVKAYNTAYYKKNREKMIAANKEREKTPEYKEWADRYRKSDEYRGRAKKYYEDNRDERRRYAVEYGRANRHKKSENKYRERCRTYGITPVIRSFTIQELTETHGDACIDCGGDWSEIDHVIPVRFGGEHSLDNCQPVCGPCNIKRWHHFRGEAYDMIAKLQRGEAA